MTPAEAAVQAVADSDPGAMNFSEWASILAYREEFGTNRIAAERVWKAVVDKQKGGMRLKIPIKILAVAPDRIDGAITDRNQASRTVDIVVSMARSVRSPHCCRSGHRSGSWAR